MSHEAESRPSSEDMGEAEAASPPSQILEDDEIRRQRLQDEEERHLEQAKTIAFSFQFPEDDDEICQQHLKEDTDTQQAEAAAPLFQIPEDDDIRCQRIQEKSNDLLRHSRKCHDWGCWTFGCPAMKGDIAHTSTCPDGFPNKCEKCSKYIAKLVPHSISCRDDECTVPYCSYWKGQFRLDQVSECLADQGLLSNVGKPNRQTAH